MVRTYREVMTVSNMINTPTVDIDLPSQPPLGDILHDVNRNEKTDEEM